MILPRLNAIASVAYDVVTAVVVGATPRFSAFNSIWSGMGSFSGGLANRVISWTSQPQTSELNLIVNGVTRSIPTIRL